MTIYLLIDNTWMFCFDTSYFCHTNLKTLL